MVHQSRTAHRTISGQWPPQRAAYRSSSQSSIMQKWATGSGRAVAWPPRCEDLYSSQPNLGSSVEMQVPPPVPPRPKNYSLHKDHSSAPNLLEDQELSTKGLHPPFAPQISTDRESQQDRLTPSLEPTAAPEAVMTSQVKSVSNNTQVRVNTSETFQYQSYPEHQMVTTKQVIYNQPRVQMGNAGNVAAQTGNVIYQQHQPNFPDSMAANHGSISFPLQIPIDSTQSFSNPPLGEAFGEELVFGEGPQANPPSAGFGDGEKKSVSFKHIPAEFEGLPSADVKEWPPQKSQDEDPNLTTVYPSNFKLRNEMPIEQERPQVVTSQPAFKMTKPMKMRGDNKWPPASASEEPTQQEVREFIKPKKACKDYSSFFAKHALPSSYTGYRAPPGTQHVGHGEEEGASDM